MASTISRFALTTGLNTRANGAVIKPSNGLAVFCARFTPAGTNMALLKNGLRPWASAWGTQSRNHTDCSKSQSTPKRCCEIPGYTGQNATMPIDKYTTITTAEGSNRRGAKDW